MASLPLTDPTSSAGSMSSGLRAEIEALPDSQIVDIVRYAGWGRKDFIPLYFGEGDMPTPRFICDAAHQAMLDGYVFYSDQRGIRPLRDALSIYLSNLHGAEIGPERVYCSVAGMNAIMMAMQMIAGPGDEVVITTPVWPNVFSALQIVGGTMKPAPITLSNKGWHVDLDRLLGQVGPATKGIFINSPSNPTGWMMPKDDMVAVLDFCRERGLWLIVDEVYNRLSFIGDRAPSFLDIADPDDRLIVVNSFSKNWAMTGWRLGWMIGPEWLAPTFEKLNQFNTSGQAPFIQMAGKAAVEQGEPVVAEIQRQCAEGREMVFDALEALPRVRTARPDGAFYAFFSVDGEPDSMALAKRLIDEAGVGLAPGTAFGPGGDGYLRMCFAGSHERIAQGLERLTPVLR